MILTLIISQLSCGLTILGPFEPVEIKKRPSSVKPIEAVPSQSAKELHEGMIVNARCPRTRRIADSMLEVARKIILIAAKSASKPKGSSHDISDYAGEIDEIMTAVSRSEKNLPLFIELFDPMNVFFKKHLLAATMPLSVLVSNRNFDEERGEIRGAGGPNPAIRLKQGYLDGLLELGLYERIVRKNIGLPPHLIESPLPSSRLPDKAIAHLMERLGPTLAHLTVEVPVAVQMIFLVSSSDAAYLNNMLRMTKIQRGEHETTLERFYNTSTEMGRTPQSLDAEWNRRYTEILEEEKLSRADFKDPTKRQDAASRTLSKLTECHQALERIEQNSASTNVYRSFNLLQLINSLYSSFHASTKSYVSYIALLCQFYSIVRLELSDLYETPRNIPELLECIKTLPSLFDHYVSTHQQHGNTESLIRIYNVLEVILNELKVLKYNVQVAINRSKEPITDDELLRHFIKIHEAWLQYAQPSKGDIDKSNHKLCESCVFEERKKNPELEEKGPSIIAATENLIKAMQGCHDQLKQTLGEVVLTDKGAMFTKQPPE